MKSKLIQMKRISLLVLLLVVASRSLLAQETIRWNKDSAKMVLIPAGSFEMGSNDGELNEKPIHTVALDVFYMDANEVTVGQFKQFVEESGYSYDFNQADESGRTVAKYSPSDNHPMIKVTWYDAMAYAKWAGKRLPTEAEWEYAARGGLKGKRYPWGDHADVARDNANYNGVGNKDKWDRCSPVGSFESNGYGLYDMAGNVYEWCADWYRENYYSSSTTKNPLSLWGPNSSGSLVMRGGHWGETINYLRVAARAFSPSRGTRTGFRCVADVP